MSTCLKRGASELYRAKTFKFFDTESALMSIPGYKVSCVIATGIGPHDIESGGICSDRVDWREGGRRDEIAVIQITFEVSRVLTSQKLKLPDTLPLSTFRRLNNSPCRRI